MSKNSSENNNMASGNDKRRIDEIFQALPPLGSDDYVAHISSAKTRELPPEVLARAFRQLPPGAPALVDAGPGTGKTKTLVRRIVYLICEKQVPPEDILVPTFSNEAAGELVERIEKILGDDTASRIHTLTFHSFGVMILNRLAYRFDRIVDSEVENWPRNVEACLLHLFEERFGNIPPCNRRRESIPSLTINKFRIQQSANFDFLSRG